MQQNRTTLKTYFNTGDTPTEAQFADFIDSEFNPSNDTIDNIPDGTTYKLYSATEKTKLAGVATGATANSADATLLARANHTGTQAESTIATTDVTTNDVTSTKHGFAPKSNADATQFLRGGATPFFDNVASLDVTFPSYGAVSNVRDLLKDTLSTGWIEGGEITVDGANTVQVALGEGLIRATDSPNGEMYEVYWGTVTGQSVPSNTERYVYVAYNAGTPVITLSATHPTDLNTNIFLGEVHNVGGTMEIHGVQRMSGDFAHRLQDWLEAIIGTRVESGCTFSEPAARKIALTSGIAYAVNFTAITISAFDSSGADTFINYHRDGAGGFTAVTGQTQWENTKYDNNSGTLATMTGGYYANRFVMISFGGQVGVLYGQAEYATQALAQAETVPSSIPSQWGFDDHGFMVVQITFQKSAATYAAIADIRPRIGGSASVGGSSVHNDLTGKQGGTAGEYYHLTAAQNTIIGNTSGTNTGDNATNSQYSGLATSKAELAGSSSQAFAASTLTSGATLTATTGTQLGLNGVYQATPPSASSATSIGLLGQMTSDGAAISNPGHIIGTFGYAIIDHVGVTDSLAIASEGKLKVNAGTLTTGISVHAGLEDVVAGQTLTTWVGHNSTITDCNGTLNNAVGHDFNVTAVTGAAVGNIFAYRAQDVAAADAGNYAAFYGLVSAKTNHWNTYNSGSANNAFAGKTRFGGVTSPVETVDITGTLAATGTISGGNLSGTNTGDQTSIVGITGTFAQFNTAVTDAELARTDAGNTFTGVQTMTSPVITTPTGIVKGDVGLGSVDNTADSAKIVDRATNLTGGLGGSIPYQTAVNATSQLANGTSGQFLKSNGTTFAPSWATLAGGGDMLAANNLSDVASATTARNNILPSKTGNTLKVLRVNAGETDYELATISAGADYSWLAVAGGFY